MRVLGIDPSLNGTGLVVLDSVGLKVEYATVVNVGTRLGPERLHYISKAVEDVAGGYAPTVVDRVYIEGYSYGSPTNREALGELGGVIRMVLWWANVPYEVIAPTSWRLQLLGKGLGTIKKELVGAELMRRYHRELEGVELPTLDVLEAWAIAYAGMQRALGIHVPATPRPKKRSSAQR